ncbi:hypothetical protein [Rhizobium sp. RCAM05973]|uniref:hypothetical protein n=1 Tax=Rhizobium sp. RCAM05973 TaxID=2994066 RepID=UPI0022EC0D95|nr:hypothetical protein [Rhizobium sp. RCAM05973]
MISVFTGLKAIPGESSDPVIVKYVRLIGAELLDTGLCIAGVLMFFRGVGGKANFLVQGGGFKANLTSSAPGGVR